jgi:hypothetical protein
VNFLKLTPAQQEAARKKAARKAQNANGANDATIGRYFNLLKEYDAYCKEHARVQPFPITHQKTEEYLDFRAAQGDDKGTVGGLESITKALCFLVEVRAPRGDVHTWLHALTGFAEALRVCPCAHVCLGCWRV